jgi:hypothetical protein
MSNKEPVSDSNMDNDRRKFIKTNVAIAASLVSVTAIGGTIEKSEGHPDLNMKLPNEEVEVIVDIKWVPSDEPVDGASIYDHVPNTLLGKTGKDGKFVFRTKNGTVLRLVEPKYGLQQALRVVQGERVSSKDIRVSRVGEGWTLPG